MQPSERGLFVFVLQTGYFLSPLMVAGRERALVAGLRPIRLARAPVVVFSIMALLLPGVLVSLPSFTWSIVILPSVVGAMSLTRLLEARVIGKSDTSALLRLRGLSLAVLLVSGIGLVGFEVENFRFWVLTNVASLLLPVSLIWPTDLRQKGPRRYDHLVPLTIADLAATVVNRSDRLLMGLFQQNASLGSYSLVASTLEIATMPSLLMSQLVSNKERRLTKRFVVLSSGLSLVASAIAMLLGPTFFAAIFSASYGVSKTLWVLTGLSAWMFVTYRLLLSVLLRNLCFSEVMKAELVSATVAIFVFLVFIPKFSAYGAAVGTAVSSLSGVIVALSLGARSRRARSLGNFMI